jgi:hypothetical protein
MLTIVKGAQYVNRDHVDTLNGALGRLWRPARAGRAPIAAQKHALAT